VKVGSLFSGIGGIDLGLERAGMSVVWQSEIDPYASKVLAKHWPAVPNLGDITAVDWSTVERPDLVCGGYPCQPFSLAGTRNGENDPRHLWPHMRDAVRHLRPRWALLENVPGHLSMGFGRVLGDLAELGYDCEWDCIPAAAVGAPHLRYRVFVVARDADTHDTRRRELSEHNPCRRINAEVGWDGHLLGRPNTDGLRDDVPDADGGPRREHRRDAPSSEGADEGWPAEHDHITRRDGEVGDVADTGSGERLRQRSGVQRPQDGDRERNVHQWAVEPDVGRVAHGVPHRVDRLRTLGNAVVPQVAELIGRRILSVDRHQRRAVEGVLIGVADEASGDVYERVVDVVGELAERAVGIDGDGDGLTHGSDPDVSTRVVNT
jgi:DNA (cytosine-5)-methyltransferase 1